MCVWEGPSLTPLPVIHLASSLKKKDHYSGTDRVKGGEEGPGPRKTDPAWQAGEASGSQGRRREREQGGVRRGNPRVQLQRKGVAARSQGPGIGLIGMSGGPRQGRE